MSEPGERQTPLKINDKRRFTPDGDLAAHSPPRTSRSPASGPSSGPGQSALQEELAAARKRIDDLARSLQSLERDREDFKQRLLREREQLASIDKGTVATALLEAIDDLDRCLATAGNSPLATGVRLIREGLLKRALALGVERIELLGMAFDPALAEASDTEVSGVEAEEGRVTTVYRACYQLNGRVIRPGRVRVAKYQKPARA